MKTAGVFIFITCVISNLLPGRAFLFSRSPVPRSTANIVIASTTDSNNGKNNSAIVLEKKFCKKSSSSLDKVALLKQQAQKLRAEADSLELLVNETKEDRLAKAERKLEGWIDDLFVNITINDSTQVINTVEEVARVLVEGRYSPEQVDKVFQRLCQTDQADSPMMELLADATNEVDVLEREKNPNKRWNHVVERKLRKKMFAMRYGIDPEGVGEE
mmetsp:Transcript_14793/g.21820  ORF Transcript_14793/g.21820 Transcript_14793/m.21820 type:complete len:216 (+) Transcript_14793:88-735(+)